MGAWYNGVQLTATGYLAGIPIAQMNYTVVSTAQRQFTLPSNWPLVQTFYVTASGGTPGAFASIPSGQASHQSMPRFRREACVRPPSLATSSNEQRWVYERFMTLNVLAFTHEMHASRLVG